MSTTRKINAVILTGVIAIVVVAVVVVAALCPLPLFGGM